MITFFFFLIIPYATSLCFNLPNIQSSDSSSLNCTGDAYISVQGLQVTRDPNDYTEQFLTWRTGRATYIQPLRLWDNATRNLTDFTTNFSFLIQGNNYGEGLAFFLAPIGSSIPPGSAGGGFGLIENQTTTTTSGLDAFFAVKFDTYRNTWEAGLPINYVGININSRTPVTYANWDSGISYGRTNEALINYNSRTQNLSVVFTSYSTDANAIIKEHLSYKVDLRAYLPEWVTFGFSASTSESYEKNSVISWEFVSGFPVDEPVNDGGEKSKTGLVVGVSVGSVVLVCLIALVWFGLWRKRRGRKNDELPVQVQSMDDEFKKGTAPRKFSYDELSLATNNFAEEEKLGEGGFGGVYKGFLRELNSFVAVKRVSRGSKQGLKEYASEVKIISQLRHRNLVQLDGWCHENNELLLVYEFMPNGSLDSHLFKAKSLLTWEARYKIAQGLVSRGAIFRLVNLHTNSSLPWY